jgi:AraC-like DNA-binding protein
MSPSRERTQGTRIDVRRIVVAVSTQFVSLLRHQLAAYASDDWPLLCPVDSFEHVQHALRTGIDDLIIDPVSWPNAHGMCDDHMMQLASGWKASHPRARVVVYTAPEANRVAIVRRLLSLLPAIWRDAPQQAAIESIASTVTGAILWPQGDRLLALLDEVRRSPAMWTPKRIAAELCCSQKTINRYLAARGLPSLAQFLRDARGAYALALLNQRVFSPAEIAELCGWTDPRSVRRALGAQKRRVQELDDDTVSVWSLSREPTP